MNGQFVDADGNPGTFTTAATLLMPLLSLSLRGAARSAARRRSSTSGSAREFERLQTRIRNGADIRFVVSQRTRLAERVEASVARPVSLRSSLRSADFAALVEQRAATEQVFASIQYAENPAQRDFSVRVFVNLPAATPQTSSDDPHYAGSFAFFGGPPSAAGAAGAPAQGWTCPCAELLVNLSPTIRHLRAQGLLGADEPLTVQLVPTPFDRSVALGEAPLRLNAVDIITTPVIVEAPNRAEAARRGKASGKGDAMKVVAVTLLFAVASVQRRAIRPARRAPGRRRRRRICRNSTSAIRPSRRRVASLARRGAGRFVVVDVTRVDNSARIGLVFTVSFRRDRGGDVPLGTFSL